MENIKFISLNLSKEILKSLDILGYKELTKVQKEAIPTILEDKDLVVKSQTGSGKTLAFAIPIIEKVDWNEKKPQALVITPTRELAMQVKKDFSDIGKFKRLKVVQVFGKSPFYKQKNLLSERTHVVVGTPGRIIDHIEKNTLKIEDIKYLVLDEADEILNMGFLDQVEEIIKSIPNIQNTMLFSATMPEEIEEIYKRYLKDPKIINIESEDKVIDRIDQYYYIENNNKLDLLKDITINENPDICIIFCNTRIVVEQVYKYLKDKNYSCDRIHGGMDQTDRTKVIDSFKNRKFRYLIATDLLARGIDIDDVSHVINYDIPEDTKVYTHRIGRTARIGKKGKGISIISPYEEKYIKEIEKYLDIELEEKTLINKEKLEDKKDIFKEKMKTKLEKKEDKSKDLEESITTIHINTGKRNKLRPGDIVGAICSIENIKDTDIGIINVLETRSFVEILNNKGDYVLENLKTTKIKGRIRKVNKKRE